MVIVVRGRRIELSPDSAMALSLDLAFARADRSVPDPPQPGVLRVGIDEYHLTRDDVLDLARQVAQ